ncbi:retrotransposon protein putative Ty1-copia subclass, partial [Trifolium medium]|nr:retrotransposon protein putative Ty1-copia subclass [Trifolium medium]
GIPGVEAPRYKARLVANGFAQVEGIDYNKIFSPVVKHYSIKQSPRQWYRRFDEFLLKTEFERSNYDSCVYMMKRNEKVILYLLLYEDDILIASSNKQEIQKLKMKLNDEFEMKDLGNAKKILGMDIMRDQSKGELFLS